MTQRKEYGIAVFHHIGDVLCCTPIAKQLKADDPDCHITWYTSGAGSISVLENPYIDELVILPGDQYELDRELAGLAASRNWTRFFTPAAYLNYQAIPGGSIFHPKGTIFGIVKAAAALNWTVPFIFPFRLTDAERAEAKSFLAKLPSGRKILVETDYRSEQSPWTDEWNFDMLAALKDIEPVFIFTAKDRPPFLDLFISRYPKAVWCNLPFRLNAEIFNGVDAYVGVSSGISCLTYSDYCRTDIPRIEVTRGEHWGAAELTHHQELFLCYSQQKFHEALASLKQQLLGNEVEPDFSPRLPLDSRVRGECPHCGGSRLAPLRSHDVKSCVSCGAGFSSSPLVQPDESARVDLIGRKVQSFNAGEFMQARVEGNAHDSVHLYGALGRVSYLRELIEKAQYALRPGGRIRVTAPNIEGLLSSSQELSWRHLELTKNVWHFNPRFLKEVLIQAGFTIENWSTDTTGEERDLTLLLVGRLKPELDLEGRWRFFEEVNRRGGGNIIHITSAKRGSFKGKVIPVEKRAETSIDGKTSLRVAAENLVSVVMPCFNQEAYLAEAVESVTSQTYPNWELIVVDDGSTDSSAAKAEELCRKYSSHPIQLVRIEHSGEAEARDAGVAIAKGDWIVPLDSDDRLKPRFLERTLAEAQRAPNAAIIYAQQEQTGLGDRLWSPGNLVREHVLAGIPYPLLSLAKREFWFELGGFNIGSPLPISAQHFWLSALTHNRSAQYVAESLAEFRITNDAQLHYRLNANWRLAQALACTAHPALFSQSQLSTAYHTIANAPREFHDKISAQILRFPGLSLPYLWRGLIREQNFLFEQALSDYDACEQRERGKMAQAAARRAEVLNRMSERVGTEKTSGKRVRAGR